MVRQASRSAEVHIDCYLSDTDAVGNFAPLDTKEKNIIAINNYPQSMPAFFEQLRDLHPPKPKFTPEQYPDLTGKRVLITGTSAGLGKESTILLLLQNATVVVFNRNKAKTEAANEEIKAAVVAKKPELENVIDSRIIPVYGDLSDLTTIKPAVQELLTNIHQLDIVLLNAGVSVPPNGSVTKQGYELQFGINVLGHQLLLKLIDPLIQKSLQSGNKPRVIFLSSSSHINSPKNGGIDYNRGFKDASIASSVESYGQSKVGNIYQAKIYGELNPDTVSLPVHPGVLKTEITRSIDGTMLGWLAGFIQHPPIYGAYTELFAALHPDITPKDNGRYVGPWGTFRPLRSDIEAGLTDGKAQKLWDTAEKEIAEYA